MTAMANSKPVGQTVPRGRVVAWGVWDWGSAAFNAVILTFVFSVYLTDAVGDDLPGDISANTWFGWSLGLAGFFIAVLAPVTGQRADAGGRRKLSLGHLDRADRAGDARPVLGEERLPLPVARPAADGPRLDLLRVRRGVVQRDAAPGFDAGEHRPGLRVRLVDGLFRRHRAAADLLRRVHRTRRRLVRGDVRGRPEHPDGGAVRRRLVRALRDPGAAEGAGDPARPGVEAGRLLRVLRGAFPRPAGAVPDESAHRVLPRRQRAVPGRPGRGLHLRRGPGRHRLRDQLGRRADLRRRRQRRRPRSARWWPAGSTTGSARRR